MQILTRLGIWFLEILTEAFGTCFLLIVEAFVEFHGKGNNDLSLRKIIGVSLFILIEFAITGYLVTTVISRLCLRGKKQGLYPFVAATLYLLHSSIFFVAAGNSLFRTNNLIIQFSGACLTFACSWLGNCLLMHWSESKPLSTESVK